LNILVECPNKNINDILVSYSILPLLRQKYNFANITLAVSEYDTMFFRRSKVIDNVVLQSNSGNPHYWTQYDFLLSHDFTFDERWNPKEILGELDTPNGWLNCPYGLDFEFLKSDYDSFDRKYGHIELTEKLNTTRIGLFFTVPRNPDPLWNAFNISPTKWTDIINGLNDWNSNLEFYFFTSVAETGRLILDRLDIKKKNVKILGNMTSIEMAILADKLDYIIGASSGMTNAFFRLFGANDIILCGCDDKGKCLWGGIPHECIPHLRFQCFADKINSPKSIFHIFPFKNDKTIPISWETQTWGGAKVTKNVLSLDNIRVEDIIDRGIIHCDDYDISPNNILEMDKCKSCELFHNDKCIYWWRKI
jgi:hypothetical protein